MEVFEIVLDTSDWSNNYYILEYQAGNLSTGKKEQTADMKINRKTTALPILYQEEIIRLSFNENKTFQMFQLFVSNVTINPNKGNNQYSKK